MKDTNQINEFIENHNLKNELLNSFNYLLEKNSSGDLDIEDKNISINENVIKYKLLETGFHSFQSPILKNGLEIGHYSLNYDDKGVIKDDFFIIKTK
ncbi:hypothetical protein [Epilithonimonas lactis]|uniref:Uncharacterized protein n=1 Tax=Epilithonimonas lactis TaxID=421072 RepID=A0A085BMZ1_9FLAO|nr:hypothetical protein [Epilithonimonas lactis]KFC23836.1 hypothetical protein IO89_04520 [Epilithonimonas lactis]SEQ27087.1 hypothetical protein SAMN04488097_1878 [Epilithonimonas lactis]